MSYWSSKERHGLYWGWHQRKADAEGWGINSKNYEPCDRVEHTDGTRHLFKFGNEWASKQGRQFQHPSKVTHDNWHFWDNPEIPQLLWPNPANPQGAKDWMRWVPGEILTTQKRKRGSERVNRTLRTLSGGALTTWEDLVKIRPMWTQGKDVLMIVCSQPNYPNYYNTTAHAWIKTYASVLEKQGYRVEIRLKASREARAQGGQLTDQLNNKRYAFTVSQHSVGALESILAGTPAIVTGPHPAGDLATTWQQFMEFDINLPHPDDVRDWCDWVLGNCWHKQDIIGGTWYDQTME